MNLFICFGILMAAFSATAAVRHPRYYRPARGKYYYQRPARVPAMQNHPQWSATAAPSVSMAPRVAMVPQPAANQIPPTKQELEQAARNGLAFRLESATNGLPTSQYNVGCDYLTGSHGLDADPDLGQYWILQSAAQGYIPAIEKLRDLKPMFWELILTAKTNSITAPDNH